jgi:protein-export membrane protein SecD
VSAATIVLSAYFLFNSVRYYAASPDRKSQLVDQNPDLHKKIVNLGLDLQGGMRLVLEVDKSQLTPDEQKDVLDRTMTVVENRVNGLGVAEPVVQKQGEDRLIIELPGLQDAERAKKVLGNTALLEFKLMREVADLQKTLEVIDNALAGSPHRVDSTKVDTAAAKTGKEKEQQNVAKSIFQGNDSTSEDTTEVALHSRKPFSSMLIPLGGDIGAEEKNRPKIDRMLNDSLVVSALRMASLDGSVFAWGNEVETYAGKKFQRIYFLKKKPELTGSAVADAKASISSGGLQAGASVVDLTLTSTAARKFAKITGANIDKRLAIVLDSTVYSAPVIKSKISGGQAQITGMKSMDEARDLSIVLRAGALPAPAKVIEERTVGPTLGQESIHASLYGVCCRCCPGNEHALAVRVHGRDQLYFDAARSCRFDPDAWYGG